MGKHNLIYSKKNGDGDILCVGSYQPRRAAVGITISESDQTVDPGFTDATIILSEEEFIEMVRTVLPNHTLAEK
jgi:hypothetical protein